MKRFDVVHNDGAIRVTVDDDGYATLVVFNIEDSEVLVRAVNRAHTEGAIGGTMFTGEVVNSQIERMHTMRASTGTTWLGGKVTRLKDGDFGPTFRIDWEVMPFITEVGE